MKKITLEITERQYSAYQRACEELLTIGIPVTPKSIMQVMITNRNQSQISEDFLKMMKTLIMQGRSKLNPAETNKAEL